MGFVEFDFTLVFQLLNTGVLLLFFYVIFKLVRRFLSKKKNFESRLEDCENELELLRKDHRN